MSRSSRLAASSISADRYGTHRWLQNDPSATHDVRGTIAVGSRSVKIEVLPQSSAELFPHLRPAANLECRDIRTLIDANHLLASEAGLEDCIGELVHSIHVLRTDEGYDTSHSDPGIPFSIFVSIPTESERDIELRVAESVLHETMHLQLTLIEEFMPLIANASEGYSPWQRRVRPVQGLLHGLYVFAVIHQFMDKLSARNERWRSFARKRCFEIATEISFLADFEQGLTTSGKDLRRACLAVFH